jgi:MtN3 and saliva related transmembrane protein
MIDFVTLIGFIAACVSTTSMFPQIAKVWRTKSVKDISLGMFLIMTISVSIWLTYGLLSYNLPIIASNSIVFAQVITMLMFKHKFSQQNFPSI